MNAEDSFDLLSSAPLRGCVHFPGLQQEGRQGGDGWKERGVKCEDDHQIM